MNAGKPKQRSVGTVVERKLPPDNAHFLFCIDTAAESDSERCNLHWESCTCFAKLSSRSYHTHVQAACEKRQDETLLLVTTTYFRSAGVVFEHRVF